MTNASLRAAATCLVAAALLLSCQTVPAPEDIPEGLSQAELFQRAQEAVDSENYEAALVYYETFLDRFSEDYANRAAAKYEVAFIYYRRGDLVAAEELFEALLLDYEDPSTAPQLPEWPRILATRLLAIIDAEQEEAVPEDTE